jgi:hypothetical protein
VKRLAIGWGAFALLATLGLVLARVFQPGRLELELDVYILVVGGVALLNVVILIREAYPLAGPVTQIARALEHDEPEPQRLPELERVERELTMSTATSFDLHTRFRPLVRDIATARLGARGRKLEASEGELGEELWALVRPDRPVPTDRHGAGISRESVARIVERLEAL